MMDKMVLAFVIGTELSKDNVPAQPPLATSYLLSRKSLVDLLK